MKSLRIKTLAAMAALTVSMASVSGCMAVQASGISATSSSAATKQETVTETTASAAPKATSATTETEAGQNEITFTIETINAKKKALEGSNYAAGTTYIGESQNQAAMEVVLAELGVDESVINSATTRMIDCGGTDIWFICFSDDVTSVEVVLGDEIGGKELYKADNPGYIFIRCFSTGEIPPCTVLITGRTTGQTAYFPFFIGGDIVLPNGGTVMNQTKDINSFIDIPEETDNSEETEEEEP